MPRRYADYLSSTAGPPNTISTIGSFILGASILPFFYNVYRSYRYGEPATADDPWDIATRWNGRPPARHPTQLHLHAAHPLRTTRLRAALPHLIERLGPRPTATAANTKHESPPRPRPPVKGRPTTATTTAQPTNEGSPHRDHVLSAWSSARELGHPYPVQPLGAPAGCRREPGCAEMAVWEGVRTRRVGHRRRVAALVRRSAPRRAARPHRPGGPRVLRDVVVPKHETWVATVDNSVVGMMVLGDGELDQLYVDPSWQGCGIGHRWSNWRNSAARRTGVVDVPGERPGPTVLQRHGFVAVERTDVTATRHRTDVRYVWRP